MCTSSPCKLVCLTVPTVYAVWHEHVSMWFSWRSSCSFIDRHSCHHTDACLRALAGTVHTSIYIPETLRKCWSRSGKRQQQWQQRWSWASPLNRTLDLERCDGLSCDWITVASGGGSMVIFRVSLSTVWRAICEKPICLHSKPESQKYLAENNLRCLQVQIAEPLGKPRWAFILSHLLKSIGRANSSRGQPRFVCTLYAREATEEEPPRMLPTKCQGSTKCQGRILPEQIHIQKFPYKLWSGSHPEQMSVRGRIS